MFCNCARLKTQLNNCEMILTVVFDEPPSMLSAVQPSNLSPMTTKTKDKERESKSIFLIFSSQFNRFFFSFKAFPSVRWR